MKDFMDILRGKNMYPLRQDSSCDSYSSQNSCDAVADCTWCKSAAVKSSCNSIEAAKSLPPSIFACDKLQDEEESSMTGAYQRGHGRDHHRRHHGFCPVPLLLVVLIAAHMYFLKRLGDAQKSVIALGGKLENKCCKKTKAVKEQAAAPAQPSFNYPIYDFPA